MRWLVTVLVLLLLSTNTLSWGPDTHDYMCRTVVSAVWGSKGLECLSSVGDDYCSDLKTACGQDAYSSCAQFYSCIQSYSKGNAIDPASYTEFVLQDVKYHYDYSSCPIKWFHDNEWVCSSTGSPAKEKYEQWIRYAEDASSLCSRVARFCTAGNYYADSKFPLYQVDHLVGCMGLPLDDEVDIKVKAREKDWVVKKQCSFSYMKDYAGVKREDSSHIMFLIRQGDVDSIIKDLIGKAKDISLGDYASQNQLMNVEIVGVQVQNSAPPTMPVPAETAGREVVSNETTSTTQIPFIEDSQKLGEAALKAADSANNVVADFSKHSAEYDYMGKRVMLVFVLGLLVACIIFLSYVLSQMKAKSVKTAGEAKAPLAGVGQMPAPQNPEPVKTTVVEGKPPEALEAQANADKNEGNAKTPNNGSKRNKKRKDK